MEELNLLDIFRKAQLQPNRYCTATNWKQHGTGNMAVVYAVERFEIYLLGIPFTVFTDCEALSQTLNRQRITPKLARWALYLEKMDYTIKHRSGGEMAHVDALSRYLIDSKEFSYY